MANRTFNRLDTLGRNQVELSGHFHGDDGYSVNVIADSGVASVTRSSTGTYVLNLSDTYSAFVSGQVQVQLASTADLTATLGAVDLSAKTVTIFVRDGSAAADITNNSGDNVCFTLRFKN